MSSIPPSPPLIIESHLSRGCSPSPPGDQKHRHREWVCFYSGINGHHMATCPNKPCCDHWKGAQLEVWALEPCLTVHLPSSPQVSAQCKPLLCWLRGCFILLWPFGLRKEPGFPPSPSQDPKHSHCHRWEENQGGPITCETIPLRVTMTPRNSEIIYPSPSCMTHLSRHPHSALVVHVQPYHQWPAGRGCSEPDGKSQGLSGVLFPTTAPCISWAVVWPHNCHGYCH